MKTRTLHCECGKAIKVINDKVESVQCYSCLTGMAVIPDGYWEDIKQAEKKLDEEKTVKRGRGRPRKHPVTDEPKVKRGRGRPRKEKSMSEQNAIKVKGKRGRKANVGAKVLQYIKENKTAKFNDILTVYSAERERLGKKQSETIEKRNCLSTLYILKRDGKINEIESKAVYGAVN